MIKILGTCILLSLVLQTFEQSTPLSPCPNVFEYEAASSEPGRWYGVVNLSTDSTLHSLWLNIVLDSKADILGNWVGDVSTTDNTDFKIENTKMKIQPGPAVAVRFFVQFNPLNKPPRLQAIRLNGREICNAKNRLPAIERPDIDSRPNRQETTARPSEPRPTRPTFSPINSDSERVTRPTYESQDSNNRPGIHPTDRPQTRPVPGRPSPNEGGPVYVPSNTQTDPNANPYSIGDGQVGQQSVGTQTGSRPNFGLTTSKPVRTTTKQDEDYDSKPDPDDYFSGPQPTFILSSRPNASNNNNFFNTNQRPTQNNQNSESYECGKVVRNNPNPLVVNGKPTHEGQWPWQIALYQTQTVDNKYICGGTLVSLRHVITAAHCVTRKGSKKIVNKNTLTVYLGKHNLRTSVEGVQIRLVGGITVHPQYNASSYGRDVGILELRESVQVTDWVRPACLWPDDQTELRYVIGKKGAVVGWGFDDTGVATEELTLVEMPVVDQESCIRSYSEFFARFTSEYTFCAGYRDGTSVCNGDSGGGMVFKMQNAWFLRGLVSLSVARQNEYRCDPTHYVVFTDLAKFLPWIKEHIGGF